jgi:hypothetical protein
VIKNFPQPSLLSVERTSYPPENVVLKQTSSSSMIDSTRKADHSTTVSSFWSLFLITCKASLTGIFVKRLRVSKLTRIF